MRVTMECGARTVLLTVDEPNRCTYTATMATPVLCTQEAIEGVKRDIAAVTGGKTSAPPVDIGSAGEAMREDL
jgi:Glucosidase II beta subunit-like protein